MDATATTGALRSIPFECDLWSWGGAEPTASRFRGRDCVLLESSLSTVTGLELVDGVIEVELAVGPERGFHGVVWRLQDDVSYESFFVRPHQVGNPDAVQYTPVFNDIPGWQLYHGPGFWAPISFPLDDWFGIRVAFAGSRAEVFVGDMERPALAIGELKRRPAPGRVGVLVSGPGVHLAGFAVDDSASVAFREPPPPPAPALDGIVPAWWVSEPFGEDEVASATLDPGFLAARTWTQLASEPSGLADLSRLAGIRDGRNTVLARTTIRSARRQAALLELGFSDRAVVYLDGRALYRGDASYRSRDYRFLGSIGWYDSVYLPLAEGDNELVVAVSEDVGGWGVQARLPDRTNLSFA